MEKYERKIKIKKELATIDTNNDGIEDTIVYINSDDLFVSVILKQTIKDLGVYTDYEEEPEIIDLDNLWDTTHDGSGDGGTNPIFDGEIEIEYDETESFDDQFELDIYGCTDPDALNFDEDATIDDGSCEYPPVAGCMDPFANNYDPEATVNDGSCEYDDIDGGGSIQGGCFKILVTVPFNQSENPIENLTNQASQFCQGTHPGCGDPIPIQDNCPPNGCLNTPVECCPNGLQLLTEQMCQDSGFNCDADDCDCNNEIPQQIFGGIKTFGSPEVTQSGVQVGISFYCV